MICERLTTRGTFTLDIILGHISEHNLCPHCNKGGYEICKLIFIAIDEIKEVIFCSDYLNTKIVL